MKDCMRRIASFLLIASALLLVSYGGNEEVEGLRKSQELIGGQVFIVIQGEGNVKLGLISVRVFDEESMEKIQQSAESTLESSLASVGEDSSWDNFKAAYLSNVFAKIALVKPNAVSKSDINGRFLFSPPSAKFLLAATSLRKVEDRDEEYNWLAVFEHDAIGPDGLFLSNDNLVGIPEVSLISFGEAEPRFREAKAFVVSQRAEEEARLSKQLAEEEAHRAAEMLRFARKTSEKLSAKHEVLETGMEMLYVKPGTFTMGSPPNEKGRRNSEGPQTDVTISRGFLMSKYEVTQAQYNAVMGGNPSRFQGDSNPVERVSWNEAVAYCAKLTEQEKAAGRLSGGYEYRLPTEAEWEYACRAGTTTRFSYGDDLDYSQLGEYAWYVNNSSKTTHPVGRKKPNEWGLYDMHGNVWEWCQDWWGDYPGGSVTDPQGPAIGSYRVGRGGCWTDSRAWYCRSAYRIVDSPDFRASHLGFRPVLAPVL